jgi:hypothetical protein
VNSVPLINLPISQSGNSVPNPNQAVGLQDEGFSLLLEQLVNEVSQIEANLGQTSQPSSQTLASKSQLQSDNNNNNQSISSQETALSAPTLISNQMPPINLQALQTQPPLAKNLSSSQFPTQSQDDLMPQSNINIPIVVQTSSQTLASLQNAQSISAESFYTPIITQGQITSSFINNNSDSVTDSSSEENLIDEILSNPLNLTSVKSSNFTQATSENVVSSVSQANIPQTQVLTTALLNQSDPSVNIANSNDKLDQGSILSDLSSQSPLQKLTNILGSNPETNTLPSNTPSNPTLNLQISFTKSIDPQFMTKPEASVNQSISTNFMSNNPILFQNASNQQGVGLQNQIVAQDVLNNLTSQIFGNTAQPTFSSQVATNNALSYQIISNLNQTNSLSSSFNNKTSNSNEAVLSGLSGIPVPSNSVLLIPNQGISYHSISIDAYQKIQNMMQDLRFNSPKDIEFLLEPPDLGKVKLNVSLDKATNAVNMTFFVVDELAKHAILSNMQDFRQILHANGFETNNVNVFVDSEQRGQGFNQGFNHVTYSSNNNDSTSLDTALITGLQSLKSGVDVIV